MKKMNQVKQVLNTCSPLEKIVKINGALGTGVSTLSKKLCSECKHREQGSCHRKIKDEPTVAGTKQQATCRPCEKFQTTQTEEHESSTTSIPGCMPFADVPVQPVVEEDPMKIDETIHPSIKKKTCGCNTGTTIPPEDNPR